MANKYRAEVDASAFGPGCVLRLTTTEAVEIENLYGEQWIVNSLVAIDRLSPKAIKTVVELGLYNGRNNKVPADQIPWPPVPLRDLAPLCSDAVLLLVHGKTAADLNAETAEKAPEADPQTADAGQS